MGLPLYMTWCFSLEAFNILSFFCVLNVLTIICCGEALFWSCLFGVLETSQDLESFLLLFFKIFPGPLVYTFSLSSMPMIHGFVLLMEFQFLHLLFVLIYFFFFSSSDCILSSSPDILSSIQFMSKSLEILLAELLI
jgi:hypothetical protein